MSIAPQCGLQINLADGIGSAILAAMTKTVTDNRTPEAVADIARISEVMGRMRLMIGRRVISRTLVDSLAPNLEISHLDALRAMRRIEGEVTVGAIAEVMRLDPSRGSRLVAELVTQGLLRRDASQADGRRSIVVRTELGDRLMEEIDATKQQLLASMLDGWADEELGTFAVLFDKFVSKFEETYPSEKAQGPAALRILANAF
jgi:DNA-binding MarR family transcriptional regulator